MAHQHPHGRTAADASQKLIFFLREHDGFSLLVSSASHEPQARRPSNGRFRSGRTWYRRSTPDLALSKPCSPPYATSKSYHHVRHEQASFACRGTQRHRRSKMSLIACGSVGWMADMNVRPGRCAGHATSKRDKRYTRAAQMADQRLAFGAVRVERDVH